MNWTETEITDDWNYDIATQETKNPLKNIWT